MPGEIRFYTTVAIGPDGRIFDLSKDRFPKQEDYIPVNAFVIELKDLAEKLQQSKKAR